MKQSFTLKAVALGLAAVATLGASAVRPQLQGAVSVSEMGNAKFTMAKGASTSIRHTPKSAQSISAPAANKIRPAIQMLDLTAQAASRAIDPYGPWQDAGTLDYTFTQLFKNEFINEGAMVKTYSYQKRVHAQNDQQFQIKVSNWGAFTEAETGDIALPGSELILTITPVQTQSGQTFGVVTTAVEGVALGWSVGFRDQQTGTAIPVEMYYYDAYNWIKNAAKFVPGYSQSVENFYGSSLYDYKSGKFEILPSYAGAYDTQDVANASLEWGEVNAAGDGYAEMWYDYIQLSGKFYNYDGEVDADAGYFYRNAGETNGYYKAPFAINDNALGVVKLLNKEITDTEFNAEFNTMISAINNPTSDMFILTSPEGWFDLPVAPYQDGNYTLLFGFTDGIENAEGMVSFKGTYYDLVLEGADYVLDGFAKYTDAFMAGYLSMFGLTAEQYGLPTIYTTTCSVEKSETTPGSYRLRAPFAQYPAKKAGFNYMQEVDYLYYNVLDPSKATIEPSMLGVWTRATLTQNGDPKALVLGAASESLATGMEINNGFGVFANNKLTFPGENYKTTIDGKERELGPLATLFWNVTDGGALYITAPNPGDFLLETGVVDAIENVEASADVNAPVEYYNLQGQKVVNPAAGQLVIKKQGSKVTKMIAQ